MSLDRVVGDKRVAITMGPGGVGKTSVAAALGLQAAVSGRRALVMTIDPALRLAEALGLGRILPGDHHTLSIEDLQRAGVQARAALTVSMLDTSRAWADVIAREVSSLGLRKQILNHPYFRRLSADLAGSREYAAMEELYHLYLRGNFDLLILDTPPTVHGFDFLEAPDRVLDVLEHDSYRFLLRPALLMGKMGLRVLDFSGNYIIRTLTRFTGLAFLQELAGFVDMFSGLLEGFRQRAAAVKATLRSPVTAFVLVTTADPGLAEETLYLHRRLCRQDLPPDTLVINRVAQVPFPLPLPSTWREETLKALEHQRLPGSPEPGKVLEAMMQTYAFLHKMAVRDLRNIERLAKELNNTTSLAQVPLQNQDIHDLASLEKIRRILFATSGELSPPKGDA